jgi:cell fate regulator YaaT (PSP1 superfamily)
MATNVPNKPKVDTGDFTHFVGIKFLNGSRAYFFGFKDLELKLNDKVVVDTARGLEVGVVAIAPITIEKYTNNLGLKPVLRLATDVDLKVYQINQKDAVFAMEICKSEIARLKLDMNIISCEYTLDKSKVLFTYLADDRVDFRDLLKSLAPKLHTRIELRQIGSRDKAKMIGGIGICGQKLCCSTFLNEFDGISINRAKNQMLAINVPKLSGHCGKLICCLKFEDDAYTEERKKYPPLGSKLFLDNQEYTLTNINIISGVVKIENQEDVKFIPYCDLAKQAKFKKKKGKDEEK